jgi:hypothetical protein
MKIFSISAAICLLAFGTRGEVRVFVQDTNGLANINYQCTAAEVVRSFALDVTVDQGQILGVTNYFRGPSTAAARGYGIFPAAFRDTIIVMSGTNADWTSASYSPLAVVSDDPAGTLPGLNSSGVTLEFGALWEPNVAAAAPPASGTLCTLRLSQTAHVSVAANSSRGGILAAPSDVTITPQFTAALVGPAIASATLLNGVITVQFQGGELESAPSVNGPWVGTGNTSGVFTQAVGTAPATFYRVHNH